MLKDQDPSGNLEEKDTDDKQPGPVARTLNRYSALSSVTGKRNDFQKETCV
jgi:hypothetical protein